MNFFYLFFKLLLFIPLRLIFPVKVLDKKNFPKKRKSIVVANHLSWLDIIIIAIYVPKYRHFVAKKELGKNPFIRFLLWALGAIYIDRSKSDMTAIKKIIKLLKKGHGINIFPEGTRNRVDDSVQQIKNGVVMFSLKSDTPIAPIMIHEKTRAFRRNYMLAMPEMTLDEYKNKPLSSVMKLAANSIEDVLTDGKTTLSNRVIELKMKKRKSAKLVSQSIGTESTSRLTIETDNAKAVPQLTSETEYTTSDTSSEMTTEVELLAVTTETDTAPIITVETTQSVEAVEIIETLETDEKK